MIIPDSRRNSSDFTLFCPTNVFLEPGDGPVNQRLDLQQVGIFVHVEDVLVQLVQDQLFVVFVVLRVTDNPLDGLISLVKLSELLLHQNFVNS